MKPVLQRGALDATPADIVAYCSGHWSVQHGETVLSDGSIRPAPSSLEFMLSQLSGVFELQGHCGDWDLYPGVSKEVMARSAYHQPAQLGV